MSDKEWEAMLERLDQLRLNPILDARLRWQEVNERNLEVTICRSCTYVRLKNGTRYGAGLLVSHKA